jgi:hypothetical protein
MALGYCRAAAPIIDKTAGESMAVASAQRLLVVRFEELGCA